LNDGLERSKALRGTRFTDPPRALAGMSGVRDLETSMREALLRETCSSSCVRPALDEFALAIGLPSIVIGV